MEAPVDITSSTSATRRPAATGTLARSNRRRCAPPVVIDLTGSAIASARWIFWVFWKIR